MTKQAFMHNAVISMLANPNINCRDTESYWVKAEAIWKANPSKGSDSGNKRSSRFIPPTPQEVDKYIKQQGYKRFTGRQFCDHYQTKDWYVGKNKMKCWQSAVRTWGSKEQTGSGGSGKPRLGFV